MLLADVVAVVVVVVVMYQRGNEPSFFGHVP